MIIFQESKKKKKGGAMFRSDKVGSGLQSDSPAANLDHRVGTRLLDGVFCALWWNLLSNTPHLWQ